MYTSDQEESERVVLQNYEVLTQLKVTYGHAI